MSLRCCLVKAKASPSNEGCDVLGVDAGNATSPGKLDANLA